LTSTKVVMNSHMNTWKPFVPWLAVKQPTLVVVYSTNVVWKQPGAEGSAEEQPAALPVQGAQVGTGWVVFSTSSRERMAPKMPPIIWLMHSSAHLRSGSEPAVYSPKDTAGFSLPPLTFAVM